MKRNRWISIIMTTAALLGTVSGTAQAANQLEQIKAAGVLKVATSLGVPPYTYTDANLKPIGSDVETAELLAHDLGVKLEIVSTTVSARIPTLQSGKADVVISVLAKSPEREKAIDFSIPYSVNENVVMALKSLKITSFPDLAGQVVGVTRGTVEDKSITENAKGATIRRYEDVPTLITAAVSNQVKILTGSLTTLADANKASHNAFEKKFVLLEAQLGIGIRKNNPEFRAWVDQWIQTNLHNGKLNAIYKKYNGVDLPEEMTKTKG